MKEPKMCNCQKCIWYVKNKSDGYICWFNLYNASIISQNDTMKCNIKQKYEKTL